MGNKFIPPLKGVGYFGSNTLHLAKVIDDLQRDHWINLECDGSMISSIGMPTTSNAQGILQAKEKPHVFKIFLLQLLETSVNERASSKQENIAGYRQRKMIEVTRISEKVGRKENE